MSINLSCVFSPKQGAFLWVEFGAPVHYYDLKSCDSIFEDVDGLGKGAWCIWAGPMSLAVIFGSGSNLLGVGEYALKVRMLLFDLLLKEVTSYIMFC